MNNSYESYELKLDNIINDLNNKDMLNKEDILNKEDEIVEKKNMDIKNKQFESINYCYEMYKVRKNKKADFDIHNMNDLNIEDDDIDKIEKVLGWKDLNDEKKNEYIEIYIDELYDKYKGNIKKMNIKEFILSNKSKIKYNKRENKIDDIQGMICINGDELIIKKKESKSNNLINKLRKSIKK